MSRSTINSGVLLAAIGWLFGLIVGIKSVTESETRRFDAVVGHLTRRAHAEAYSLDPLSGRGMQFVNVFRNRPPTGTASGGCA